MEFDTFVRHKVTVKFLSSWVFQLLGVRVQKIAGVGQDGNAIGTMAALPRDPVRWLEATFCLKTLIGSSF